MAQQDRSWIGLVVEALLNAPLGLLIDPRFLPSNEAGVWQRLPHWRFVPTLIRHRRYGIHEFCRAVFSQNDYLFEVPAQQNAPSECFTFVSGLTPLTLCVDPELEPYAMVIDPTWPHSVQLRTSELRDCLAAWHAAPASEPSEFCHFELSHASAAMLARLQEFLPQLPSAEQACVWRAALMTQPRHLQQTLLVRGADDASLARICKALPLLNWGLAPEDRIGWVISASDSTSMFPLAYEARRK